MLSKAMACAIESGATLVTGAERDYRTARVEAFELLGFDIVQRDPSSKLDLESFDASRYDDVIAKVEKGGITFQTVAELAQTQDDWIMLAHSLQCEVSEDVPGMGQHKPISLEDFTKWMHEPSYRGLEDWVIALEGEKWVGMSNLYTTKHNPEMALTVMTGVVRSHRRRGIATALKAKALAGAKAAGAKVVKTGNEENNPMLQLNLALGFVPDYTVLVFEKEILR
jgi:GNAT superfamily N-acetyltransferase